MSVYPFFILFISIHPSLAFNALMLLVGQHLVRKMFCHNNSYISLLFGIGRT